MTKKLSAENIVLTLLSLSLILNCMYFRTRDEVAATSVDLLVLLQIIVSLISIVTGLTLLYKFKKLGLGSRIILFNIVVTMISAVFSDYPKQVLGYSLLLSGVGMLLIGYLQCVHSTAKLYKFERVFVVVSVVILLKNAVHGYLFPEYDFDRLGGGLIAANTMGFMSLIVFWMTYSFNQSRFIKLVRVLLFAFVLLSRSRVSIACMFMTYVLSFWFFEGISVGNNEKKKKLATAISFLSVSMLAFYFLAISFDIDIANSFFDLYNRNADIEDISTLTKRTEIWELSIGRILESPKAFFFGHGYGASKWTLHNIGGLSNFYKIPHAHNTLLEFMLGMGLLGAFSCLGIILYGSKVFLMAKKMMSRDDNKLLMRLLLMWLPILFTAFFEAALAERLNFTIFVSFYVLISVDFMSMKKNKGCLIVSSDIQNYCQMCPKDLHCCHRLEGLRVTHDEYVSLFQGDVQKYHVEKQAVFYKITTKGESCPHWDQGCTVYDKRPLECGLYPYTMGNPVTFLFFEVFHFHNFQTGCPSNDEVIISVREAKKAIKDKLKTFKGFKLRFVFQSTKLLQFRHWLRSLF
jgi:O-antigen ligase